MQIQAYSALLEGHSIGQAFDLDAHEFSHLYYRCIRCMYLRLHDRAAGIGPDPFLDEAVAAIYQSAQPPDSLVEVGATSMRILCSPVEIASVPLQFVHLGTTLRFTGKAPAIAETMDGRRIVLKYRAAVEGEGHKPNDMLEFESYAFALEHPAEEFVEPIEVDGFALIDFNAVPVPGARLNSYCPVRYTPVARDTRAFFETIRVVARILSLAKAPPSHCCDRNPTA